MTMRVEGISGDLLQNVEARLSVIDESLIENTPRFKRYVADEIKKALRAEGYYTPKMSYSVKPPSSFSSKSTVVINVNPGEPVLIERVSVNLTGEGLHDKDYINLLRNNTPTVGDTLNHGVYESFKKSLLSLALRKGYFDADLTRHQLAVADTLHQAFWRIDFNTGERYRLGQVNFQNSPIRESYLKNIIPFNQGDYYTSDDLALFSRRLSSTNWFASVTAVPDFAHVGDDKTLPINVMLAPKKANLIDVGLGYSTDIGMRGKLNWTKPWLNSRGHSFQSNLSLSEPEQSLTASYKIPLRHSPLEYYYTIQAGIKKEDNNDTESDSFTFGVSRNWDNFDGWQKALGINTSYDRFTQANESYNTFLIYPSVSFSRVRQEGGMMPTWGDSQRYSFEVATEYLGSDISFWSFKTQQVWIRSLYDTHRFIGRMNFGYIQSSNFDQVPPSFRFFAGGDRSIRGYGYQSVSPKSSNGKLTGASRLLTGSLEYQYNFSGSWWGAAFVDAGEAVNSFDEQDFHSGAGMGIRWVSPIGPVKLDVATPIDKSGSVHFYIGIGAEL